MQFTTTDDVTRLGYAGITYRVLRPGGGLFLIEHVLAKQTPKLIKWQRFFGPFWVTFCGNRHLTSDIELAIHEAGFSFD